GPAESRGGAPAEGRLRPKAKLLSQEKAPQQVGNPLISARGRGVCRQQQRPRAHPIAGGGTWMAEKVKQLNLERDYKKYLYFIDGEGNVCQKPKSGEGESKVLVE